MKKEWMKKIKSEPVEDLENDYDREYYSYGNPDTQSNAGNASNDLYNSYDDGEPTITISTESVTEVAKAEPLLKRTFTPMDCNDGPDVVDAMKDERVVVVCVEELDRENFLRLFDYIMGAVRALDAKFEKIDRDTVVIFPYNVDETISIDDLDEEVIPSEEEETDETVG